MACAEIASKVQCLRLQLLVYFWYIAGVQTSDTRVTIQQSPTSITYTLIYKKIVRWRGERASPQHGSVQENKTGTAWNTCVEL